MAICILQYVYIFFKIYQIGHLQLVNIIVCNLHLRFGF